MIPVPPQQPQPQRVPPQSHPSLQQMHALAAALRGKPHLRRPLKPAGALGISPALGGAGTAVGGVG